MIETRVTMDEIGTPVEGYVRESFAREKYPDDERLIEIRRQGFDRWLARHDFEVLYSAGRDIRGPEGMKPDPSTPARYVVDDAGSWLMDRANATVHREVEGDR